MSPRTPAQFEEIRNDRKEKLLAAALETFSDEGYHSASISKIAKQAGVSKGLIYNYFKSKEDVLQTLVKDLFDRVMDSLELTEQDVLDEEGFKKLVAKSLRIPLEEPKRWKLYTLLAFQKGMADILLQEMQPSLTNYTSLLIGYFDSKGLDNPLDEMRIFSAMLDGIQMHCLLDPENFPLKQAEALLIKQFT